jgi:lipopolysaccharide biosynthesis glycosyltransferase
MKIHLAIAFDESYLAPFCALLESIIANGGNVHLHLIMTGVDETTQIKISDRAKAGGIQSNFYRITDKEITTLVTRDTWTTAVYYRLYFPMLVDPSIHRLIYLDTDTIVLRNLSELAELSLDGYPVAAVYDNYVQVQPLIGINEPGNYFNSGVLVMDLNEWRRQRVSERTLDYLKQYPERIRYVDQCGLNAVLMNNWFHLKSSYNLLYSYLPNEQSDRSMASLVHEASIVHFNIERPWQMLCKNRLRNQYRKYLRRSPIYSGRVVIDFSVQKVFDWIYIRLIEFYFDQEWIKRIWRSVRTARM